MPVVLDAAGMKVVGGILVVAALALVSAGAYVRLAPEDPARWHVPPVMPEAGTGVWPVEGGVYAAVDLDLPAGEALARFDRVAQQTARTKRIAGRPETGMATYRTRSALWGFPDYTTVLAVPQEGTSRLLIHARQRYGRSDLGVNAARVRSWIEALKR